jgi:hypothetical protein
MAQPSKSTEFRWRSLADLFTPTKIGRYLIENKGTPVQPIFIFRCGPRRGP